MFNVEKMKMTLIGKIFASFDNTPDGFSARKLSAFTGVVVAIVATFMFVDEKVIISALGEWLIFAMMCLGIVTAEQILKFYKKGDDDNTPPSVPTSDKIEIK